MTGDHYGAQCSGLKSILVWVAEGHETILSSMRRLSSILLGSVSSNNTTTTHKYWRTFRTDPHRLDGATSEVTTWIPIHSDIQDSKRRGSNRGRNSAGKPIMQFGVPVALVSDHGKAIHDQLMKEVCRLMNFNKVLIITNTAAKTCLWLLNSLVVRTIDESQRE